MISEQSLEGWDNKPVKFSNVKYPQTKDNNAPQNFFLAIFCGSRGSGKTYLLTKLLKLLEEKQMYFEGNEIPQRIILICSTAHSDSNRVFKSLKNINWDEDVIEDYNDSLLSDKMRELKHDLEHAKEYKLYKSVYKKFKECKSIDELKDDEMILLHKHDFIKFKDLEKP
jgi:hypothetical protein